MKLVSTEGAASRIGELPRMCELEPLEKGNGLERWFGFELELCERAKQIPFREAIMKGTDRPVCAADFETAATTVRPTVTPDRLVQFEAYGNR